MAKRTLVLAVRRHREFLAPYQNAVLVGTTLGRARNYGGGYVEFKPLGVVNLPIPWDARTFIGIAIGAAAHGLAGNFLGQSVGDVLAQPGEAIGRAVIEEKSTIPERVRKSLRRKSAFVIPFLRVIEVAYTEGWMAPPTLHVC